jgi:hypothetical protein
VGKGQEDGLVKVGCGGFCGVWGGDTKKIGEARQNTVQKQEIPVGDGPRRPTGGDVSVAFAATATTAYRLTVGVHVCGVLAGIHIGNDLLNFDSGSGTRSIKVLLDVFFFFFYSGIRDLLREI